MSHLPLPLPEREQPASNPWQVEPHPTSLIAFWPDHAAPTELETIAALQSQFDANFEKIEQFESGHWNGVYQTPVSEVPCVIWTEPAKPLPAGELNDPIAEGAMWIVGIETVLTAPNWIDEYAAWLRALAAGLGATTILDPMTHQFWQNPRLADLIHESPAELSASDLWTIHAVLPHDRTKEAGQWLHTHGLWRCGCPEIELLEVPEQYASTAAELLNEIAAHVLYDDLPPSGEPFEIGPDLVITAHHWQEIAPHVSPHNSGGRSDRSLKDDPHGGVRAVICGERPRGMFRKLWAWPEQVIKQYSQGEAIIYRSADQSHRQCHLARMHWNDLAVAFAAVPQALHNPKTCVFLVKSPIGEGDHKEHVWFEVQSFKGDSAECKLVSKPRSTTALQTQSIVTVDGNGISDWMVQTADGRFSPSDVPAMWRAIDRLRGGNS